MTPKTNHKQKARRLSPEAPGSEILDARRHARTLREFYATHDRDALKPLVRTAIILGEEVDRLRETLRSIQSYGDCPRNIHSMAVAALSPNRPN